MYPHTSERRPMQKRSGEFHYWRKNAKYLRKEMKARRKRLRKQARKKEQKREQKLMGGPVKPPVNEDFRWGFLVAVEAGKILSAAGSGFGPQSGTAESSSVYGIEEESIGELDDEDQSSDDLTDSCSQDSHAFEENKGKREETANFPLCKRKPKWLLRKEKSARKILRKEEKGVTDAKEKQRILNSIRGITESNGNSSKAGSIRDSVMENLDNGEFRSGFLAKVEGRNAADFGIVSDSGGSESFSGGTGIRDDGTFPAPRGQCDASLREFLSVAGTGQKPSDDGASSLLHPSHISDESMVDEDRWRKHSKWLALKEFKTERKLTRKEKMSEGVILGRMVAEGVGDRDIIETNYELFKCRDFRLGFFNAMRANKRPTVSRLSKGGRGVLPHGGLAESTAVGGSGAATVETPCASQSPQEQQDSNVQGFPTAVGDDKTLSDETAEANSLLHSPQISADSMDPQTLEKDAEQDKSGDEDENESEQDKSGDEDENESEQDKPGDEDQKQSRWLALKEMKIEKSLLRRDKRGKGLTLGKKVAMGKGHSVIAETGYELFKCKDFRWGFFKAMRANKRQAARQLSKRGGGVLPHGGFAESAVCGSSAAAIGSLYASQSPQEQQYQNVQGFPTAMGSDKLLSDGWTGYAPHMSTPIYAADGGFVGKRRGYPGTFHESQMRRNPARRFVHPPVSDFSHSWNPYSWQMRNTADYYGFPRFPYQAHLDTFGSYGRGAGQYGSGYIPGGSGWTNSGMPSHSWFY